MENAVLPGRDHGAGLLFGRVQNGLDGGFDDRRTELAEQFCDAPFAEMRRAQHRGKVAAKLARVSHVQRQHLQNILARPSRLGESDRRNAQTFLPDLGRTGIIGAMGGAADIALMGADDGPQQTLVAIEHRHEDGEIRQMAAAIIGIVEQEDVARLDVLETLLDRDRRPWQRADMHRQMIGLRDQAGARVANPQRKVAAGIEDLRIGGAKHGLAHLLHDRTQPMLDDGPCDGIDLGGHSCLVVLLNYWRQAEAETSASAPDTASMIACISASVIGVDNAINPLPAASTPRLSSARLKTAWRLASSSVG